MFASGQGRVPPDFQMLIRYDGGVYRENGWEPPNLVAKHVSAVPPTTGECGQSATVCAIRLRCSLSGE
jgi:hypothetical protein